MDNGVLIIGNPEKHPSSEAFLQKFVKIISHISPQIYIISGDKPPESDNIKWLQVKTDANKNRYLKFLKAQLKIMSLSWKLKDMYDAVIILPTSFLFPNIFLKLIRKKTCLFIAQKPDDLLLSFAKLNLRISPTLIVESESVMENWNISRYREKIHIGSLYVDPLFFQEKELNNRETIIGYIGRLSEEKGILNLIHAIPEVLREVNDVKFIIAGSGDLSGFVKERIDKKDLYSVVKLIEWIPHNKLPSQLNNLLILILPSSTEGLPNIVLESMACGTPVLANSVGGIPDIIKDEYTGFLMENNHPNTIARSLINVLKDREKLGYVSKNSLDLVKDKYTFIHAVKRYKKILSFMRN